MKVGALGLIEVRGYLGAIEATDSALKSANVTCLGIEKVTGGLVTVKLTGDVAAIKAAVDAGEKAAAKLGVLIGSHVIARVHEETTKILQKPEKTESTISVKPGSMDEKKADDGPKSASAPIEKNDNLTNQYTTDHGQITESPTAVQVATSVSVAPIIRGRSLPEMKVVELRRLARKLRIKTMTFEEIKFAKKEKLIAEIEKHLRGEESPW